MGIALLVYVIQWEEHCYITWLNGNSTVSVHNTMRIILLV